MNPLQLVCFVLVGVGGTVVALTRDPKRQALTVSLYGMLLTALFLTLQAPDVALSELTIGAAALPLMILVTLASVRANGEARAEAESGTKSKPGTGTEPESGTGGGRP